MAEPIGPGDWVECIDDNPCPDYPTIPMPLVLGALYCIAEVDDEGYELVGVPPFPLSLYEICVGFTARRFRPIRDGQERIVKKERVSA